MNHKTLKNLLRISGMLGLLTMLSGCGQEPAAVNPTPAGLQQPSDMAALYGVNAQVSYAGDPGRLGDDAMVYVFLRESGSRMPLAVQHFAAAELPRSVQFPGLPPQQTVELVARLSLSGRVDRSPEDIEVTRIVASAHPPQTHELVLGLNDGAAEQAQNVVRPDSDPVQTSAEATEPVVIRTRVAIAAGHSFAADTVVFVIARNPGQKMPTVVKRLSVADLPAEIALTDADSMTFSQRLSDSRQLDLFARVSTSGSTASSADDWKSETLLLQTNNLPDLVELLISP